MAQNEALPVAVIGAGPIGLAAAAHLIARGLPVKVYEAGPSVAANVCDWGHVRLFSPWQYNTDPEARALLLRHGWQEPPDAIFPTGRGLYEAYLKPLAETPEMSSAVETATTVRAISRHGIDKVVTKGRETMPFVLSLSSRDGGLRREAARAVIDASGTWTTPNPLGAGGIPADGEAEHAGKIAYGLPDVLGRDRATYEGRATLVVGAGHSAANVLIDLVKLAERRPRASVVWVVRGTNLARVYGDGLAGQLPAGGELGAHVRGLVGSGRVTLVTGFSATAVRSAGNRVILEGETADGIRSLGPVDRIVVATGQRPDLALTRELRLELDPWLESARALGPLIDPNLHSCGSVPPHGHRELSHPEPGFYTLGVKSYGRAPTFLLLTGYEQARSVAAAIAGDLRAADSTQLCLPETGVCTSQFDRTGGDASPGCCGGPAPDDVDACCLADVEAQATKGEGCGCGAPVASSHPAVEPV